MKFSDLLSRADEEILQDLLGRQVVRLLKLLDASLTNPSQLKKILLELRKPEELLADPKARNLLVDLLKPAQAKILATILELPELSSSFKSLKDNQIRRGSERERVLFDFFEVHLPQPEVMPELPPTEALQAKYPLFAHQRKAAQQVRHALITGRRRVLLHMPTGSGKTRTAMNIVSDHLRMNEPTAVIWLAYSEELCEQAAVEFQRAWKHLGNRDVELHRLWGNYNLNPNQLEDGIVVAGLSKMYSQAKSSIQFINRMGNRSSLVVIDEAHQSIAESYKLVLDALVVPYEQTGLLGLTATPGRTWNDINADTELADFFGRCKVTLDVPGYNNPVDYLVNEGYLAKANYRSLLYDSGLNLTARDLKKIEEELDLPKFILDRLADDEQRNLRILLEIENLSYKHKRIIVFGISVQHTQLLATVLRAKGFAADAITGESSSRERDRLISDFKDNSSGTKILCNYGVLTTGFDAPRTSAVVIARPTKSLVLYSQMVGRAIRGVKAGGNETAEIVTVVDSQLPGFGSVAEAFSNWEDVWS